MTQINFRLIQVADKESYRGIRLECLTNYPEYFGDSYEEEMHADPLKLEKTFFSDSDHSFLYGAFSQDQLIGICGFVQQKRMKTRHRGDLVQVYVQPLYGGQGIGRHLIKLAIEKAFSIRTIDQILLSAVYINDKAVCLYKKLGFYQYGIIENYFKLGAHSWPQIFMVLTKETYLSNRSANKLPELSINPFDKFI